MANERVEKPASWLPQIQAKTSQFAVRPFAVQSQTPTQQEIEPQAFSNNQPSGTQMLEIPNFFGPRTPASPPPIQTKLTIGEPGDRYEQEADRVAEQVVSKINAPPVASPPSSPTVQREENPEQEDDKLMMKPESGTLQREEMPQRSGTNLLEIPNFFGPRTPASPLPIQTKLTIGQPGDQYEQEADRVAEQVVSKINAPPVASAPSSQTVQREENAEQEEDNLMMKAESGMLQREEMPQQDDDEKLQMQPMVQRASSEGGTDASPSLESSIQQARGSGQGLSDNIKQPMEQAFGADFSGVKVHTDAQSDMLNRSIGARAFATGKDIFFRGGAYSPGSTDGQKLIAHELTHVVQQNSGSLARKADGISAINCPTSSTNQSLNRGEMAQASFLSPPGSAIHVQRELLNEKDFKKVTTTKGMFGLVDRHRGGDIEKLDKAVKLYFAQPDAGKLVYLSSLITQAQAYIDKKLDENLDPNNPRIIGTQQLIESARAQITHLTSRQDPQPQIDLINHPSRNAKGEDATKYSDIDGRQYRITGRQPNRIIQEVKVSDKGEYSAMGEVVGFNKHIPVVNYYEQPIILGGWYPQITQLNGMNVKPTTGIRDAVSLQTEVNQKIDEVMNPEGVAIGKETVDVLYTYSATTGFASDVGNCIKGKIGISDEVTAIQAKTMLDAVTRGERIIVCAHSRGTIKTDNAVEQVYETLYKKYKALLLGFSNKDIDVAVRQDMDRYIKLIYAGNAVYFPSAKLPVKMFVSSDNVSRLLGTHSEAGKKFSGKKYEVERVSGAHSFSHYSKPVGQEAAQDILGR